MPRGRSTTRVYGADLETDNDGERAWIVQWAISNGRCEWAGRTLESFKEQILKLMRTGAETYIYFHNLKFDLSYIKYALADLRDNHDCDLRITMRERNPIALSLIPRDDERRTVHFRDSLKKFPGATLAQMAKLVGLEKLDGFDFYPGWSESVDFDDPANWKYVCMDARIVAVAMQQLHELGNDRATVSSDAWHAAKRIIRAGDGSKPGIDNRKWDTWFPRLPNELDAALRRGYVGGINISEHRGLCEGKILHADVTSMYPTVMMYDPLPVGLPTYTTEEPPEGTLYVVHLEAKLNLKEDWIPWWIFKRVSDLEDGITLGKPVTNCTRYHEMTLTSVDLANLQRSYDVDIKPGGEIEYFVFKSKTGALAPYVQKHMEEKERAEKGTMLYTWAKTMLNSLYGRTALNPMGQATELVADGDDLVWSRHPEMSEEHDAYLPYGMFVTSHAHTRLLDYIELAGPENVIHSDTDSVIHYGGKVEGIKYGRELGQWDIESRPVRLWEGGFKRYIEQIDPNPSSIKHYKLAAAGVPLRTKIELYDDPELILTDAELGHVDYKVRTPWLREHVRREGGNPDCLNTMKLMPKEVKGGIILTETTHKLRDNFRFGVR